MILNIIDNRNNKYKWKEITAIFEPTCHDNSVKNSDLTDHNSYDGIGYDEIEKCSLSEALEWGNKNINSVTLYIYDLGKGMNIEGE